CLLFSRNKWVLGGYYGYLILATLIFSSLTRTAIMAVVFYGITFMLLLIVPSFAWQDDFRKLKHAIRKAYHLFKTGHYPIGADPDQVERRLEYAMVLGAAETYAEQCGKDADVSRLKAG